MDFFASFRLWEERTSIFIINDSPENVLLWQYKEQKKTGRLVICMPFTYAAR